MHKHILNELQKTILKLSTQRYCRKHSNFETLKENYFALQLFILKVDTLKID